jgi:hypothetical protein
MRMLAVLGLAGACQNGYPLEPTPCDDFCRATQRKSCDDNDPAWCVADCEEQGIVQLDRPGCRELWNALLACYAAQPDEEACYGWAGVHVGVGGPCSAETIAYHTACLADDWDYYENY